MSDRSAMTISTSPDVAFAPARRAAADRLNLGTGDLLFYLGLPCAIAINHGLRGSPYAPEVPTERLILLFLIVGVPTWALGGLLLRLLTPVIGPGWLAQSIAVALAGIGMFSVSFWLLLVVILLPPGDFFGFAATMTSLPDGSGAAFFDYLTGPSCRAGMFTWCIAHALRAVLTERRPAAPSPALADAPTRDSYQPQPPPFLARLPQPHGRLLALQAQEHYVRVITSSGSHLILYRFGQAVAELAEVGGLRVHRSYWVARDAVRRVERTDRSYRLMLENGEAVPVSHGYRVVVEQAGLIGACTAAPAARASAHS